MASTILRSLGSLAIGGALWLSPATALVGVAGAPATVQASSLLGDKDTVIFRTGKVVEGKILKETDSEIEMEIEVAGIKAKTTYTKAEILSITRATPAEEGVKPATTDKPKPAETKTDVKPTEPTLGVPKVYVLELTGWFGEDISQTPLRDAVNDAKRHEPDYLIVTMNNDWSQTRFGDLGEIPEDAGIFDLIFRAVDMAPIFTQEIPRWSKPPKVVFWVKNAMGGASMLPLVSKDIYFASDAKMGGIGHLTKQFGSTGDEVVRQKQYSLRMSTAEGMALTGGYDPRLIRAMAMDEYVLSVKYEGGQPVYAERMPESADEVCLTDDAKDDRVDDIQQLARGEGNDCLTLKADIAQKLGVSKGTVDSLEDLLFQLGLSRGHQMVKGQGKSILERWSRALVENKRVLAQLWEDYQGVEVAEPGEYPQRTQARARRKAIINQMEAIILKYKEALDPRSVPVPDYNTLEIIKKRIELEQLQDKPDKR